MGRVLLLRKQKGRNEMEKKERKKEKRPAYEASVVRKQNI